MRIDWNIRISLLQFIFSFNEPLVSSSISCFISKTPGSKTKIPKITCKKFDIWTRGCIWINYEAHELLRPAISSVGIFFSRGELWPQAEVVFMVLAPWTVVDVG